MKSSWRALFLVVALALIGALLFVASRSEEGKFQAGSPEATVQGYLQAMVDRNNDQALSFFDPATECDSSDVDRQYFSPDLTVDLLESSITGDSARVKMRVRYSDGDLFGGWSEDHTINLNKVAGSWKIIGIPWPLYDCDGVKR